MVTFISSTGGGGGGSNSSRSTPPQPPQFDSNNQPKHDSLADQLDKVLNNKNQNSNNLSSLFNNNNTSVSLANKNLNSTKMIPEYSFYNVDYFNDLLVYNVNGGSDINITIPQGNYNVTNLKNYLTRRNRKSTASFL